MEWWSFSVVFTFKKRSRFSCGVQYKNLYLVSYLPVFRWFLHCLCVWRQTIFLLKIIPLVWTFLCCFLFILDPKIIHYFYQFPNGSLSHSLIFSSFLHVFKASLEVVYHCENVRTFLKCWTNSKMQSNKKKHGLKKSQNKTTQMHAEKRNTNLMPKCSICTQKLP